MKFNRLAEKIEEGYRSGIQFKDWVVHFEEKYQDCGDDPTFYFTGTVYELFADWYDQCTYCPENDAFIWNVMFSDDDGNVYLVETTDTDYSLDFATLMQFIERHIKIGG